MFFFKSSILLWYKQCNSHWRKCKTGSGWHLTVSDLGDHWVGWLGRDWIVPVTFGALVHRLDPGWQIVMIAFIQRWVSNCCALRTSPTWKYTRCLQQGWDMCRRPSGRLPSLFGFELCQRAPGVGNGGEGETRLGWLILTGRMEPSCHMFMFVSCDKSSKIIMCQHCVQGGFVTDSGALRELNWYWGAIELELYTYLASL